MMDLKKKYGEWALVTGASSGIGKAFAEKLAEMGINLILIARRKNLLQEIGMDLNKKHSIEVRIIEADLTDQRKLTDILSFMNNYEIGILVNNAGVGSPGSFLTSPILSDLNMISLNCTAPLVLTKYFANRMKHNNRGAIIFLGSVVGYYPNPSNALYSATKAFDTAFGNSIAYEMKNYNIDVLVVNPGATDTEFKRLSNSKKGPFLRSPEQVVNSTLKKLSRKYNFVDGLFNKCFLLILKFIPNKIKTNLIGKLSGSMINKKANNE